jgi:hypothetical protein
LQAVDGQNGAALFEEKGVQPPGVQGGQGTEFVVAIQEIADGALCQDEASRGQFLMNFGEAAVLEVTQRADQSHDIESELVVRQGDPSFGFGPQGLAVSGARVEVAASDAEAESKDVIEGGDGAFVVVVEGKCSTATGTGGGQWK